MSDGNRGTFRVVIDVLFGVVLACLVATAIWTVASNTTRDQIQAKSYAEYYAQDTENRIERDCSDRQGSSLSECIRQIIQTTHEQQRDEHDLAAQRGMERWAFWMLAASLGSVVVTGVGVIYVALTLSETRATTKAAARAAVAAEDAVTVTRDVGQAQVRAYLTCAGGKFNVEDKLFHFWPTVSNDGQSPAFDVKIIAKTSVMVFEGTDEKGIPKFRRVDGKQSEGHFGTIPAGDHESALILFFLTNVGVEAFNRIIKGDGFHIDCNLMWRDVFGGIHSMIFSVTEDIPMDGRAFLDNELVRTGILRPYNRAETEKESYS